MPLAVAAIPYSFVFVILMVGLEKVGIFGRTWEPPPLYIRVPVALLWPIYTFAVLVYAAFGKSKSYWE